jgi:hypothetical protein
MRVSKSPNNKPQSFSFLLSCVQPPSETVPDTILNSVFLVWTDTQ